MSAGYFCGARRNDVHVDAVLYDHQQLVIKAARRVYEEWDRNLSFAMRGLKLALVRMEAAERDATR